MRRLLHLSLVLLACSAGACRYSVRDTGFVDLDQPPWSVRVTGLDPASAAAWTQSARGRFLDSNLRWEAPSDLVTEPPPPARGAPSASLVGPDGRSLPLPMPASLAPDGAGPFFEALAISPLRDRLHTELLTSFAVLLLVEGTQPGPTSAARRVVEDALRSFTPLLSSLPKPVETPPRLIPLPASGVESERVLLWSLGLDPAPASEPRLAVLFGRGRQMGSALEGPLITRTAVLERLHLLGQDCECDLDRVWLQGLVFPARWDTSRQAEAAKSLGFDPENPLVRSEVSRIVLRGPLPGQARRSPSHTGLDTLVLGYREESLDDLPAPTGQDSSESAPESTTSTTPDPHPVQAVVTVPPPSGETLSPSPRLPWRLLATATLLSLGAGGVLLLRHRHHR